MQFVEVRFHARERWSLLAAYFEEWLFSFIYDLRVYVTVVGKFLKNFGNFFVGAFCHFQVWNSDDRVSVELFDRFYKVLGDFIHEIFLIDELNILENN